MDNTQKNGINEMQDFYRKRLDRSLTSGLVTRLRNVRNRTVSNMFNEGVEKEKRSLHGSQADYIGIKGMLQERMLLEIGEQNLYGGSGGEVSHAVQEFTARVLAEEHIPLNDDERRRLAEELTEERAENNVGRTTHKPLRR
ncbi:MAG: hypothetical protein ACPGYT_10175 [Nitrospirales bacterium]